MHAIWFSFIVPTLVAAVWTWPRLRNPKVWLGLCLATLLGTTVWLGRDLYDFAGARGTTENLSLRALRVLLSETGKPVLPLMLGSALAAMISRRYSAQASSTQDRFGLSENASTPAKSTE